MSDIHVGTAEAPSNIALVKYWGKRDERLNLPSTGSFSVTLDSLLTRTEVRFDPALPADRVLLNGQLLARGTQRITRFIDLFRHGTGFETRAEVTSQNNFPTGAGLASSASGFAALAVACDNALGLGLPRTALSSLARRGSGSAARSLFGGYVEMDPGREADGHDAFARPFMPAEHLPLALIVAVTSTAPKAVSSTEGMRRSEATSPFYRSWTRQVVRDLAAMREAVRAADLERVGELAETNCMRMHAVAHAARPPVVYWNGATVDAMQCVRALRASGTGAWFTIDAGPQVKVICAPEDAAHVAGQLASVPGVVQILRASPGIGARALQEAAR